MVSLLKSWQWRERKRERSEQPVRSSGKQLPGAAAAAAAPYVGRQALQRALDLSADPLLFISLDLRVLGANLAVEKLTGHPRDRLLGASVADAFAGTADLRRALEALLHDEEPVITARLTMRHVDGIDVPRDFSLRLAADEHGRVLIAQGVAQSEARSDPTPDIAHDPLTALSTRSALERRWKQVQESTEQVDRTVAVLFIDVDDFKQVNDRHGHPAGDRVLQEVARRLRQCVRPEDTVVRYGGDEFVVVIERVTLQSELDQIAARIHSELSFSLMIAGELVPVAASVGMAASGLPVIPEAILERADRAMYRAKRARRLTAAHA